MKTEIYILIILILLGCTFNETEFDTSEYFFTDFKSERMLYEYKNSNIDLYPVKYILIEKDSIKEGHYKYSYLDKNFIIVSGYTEIRTKNNLKIEKVFFNESELGDDSYINEVEVSDWDYSYKMEKDKDYKDEMEWYSQIQPNIKYSLSTTKKLLNTNNFVQYKGDSIPTIEISSLEITEIDNSDDVYRQILEIETWMNYGKDIGLITFEIKYRNGVGSILELVNIYKGEEIDKVKIMAGGTNI